MAPGTVCDRVAHILKCISTSAFKKSLVGVPGLFMDCFAILVIV